MKTVILHIGRGKTGTTTLQNVLASNRKYLEECGVCYPASNHQSLAKSLLDEIPVWMSDTTGIDTIQEQMKDELRASKCNTILISSENFTLIAPTRLRGYLQDVFGDCNYKIVFFARSQDELAESQYNQDVKHSGEFADFREYIKNGHLEEVYYDELLAPWDAEFGTTNIVCRIYDASRRTVVDEFFSSIDVPVAGLSRDKERTGTNGSIGMAVLEAYRVLNKYSVKRCKIYDEIAECLSSNDAPAVLFNAQEALEYRNRFSESNRRFTGKYMSEEREDLGGRRYSDELRQRLVKTQTHSSAPRRVRC